jgi:hypothetical protein
LTHPGFWLITIFRNNFQPITTTYAQFKKHFRRENMPLVFKAPICKILVVFLLVSFLELGSNPLPPAQAAEPLHQLSRAVPASFPVSKQTNRAIRDGALADPAVTIGAVWVKGYLGRDQAIFNIGDQITYTGVFLNNTGEAQVAPVIWEVNGPCGSIYSQNGDYSIGKQGYVLSYTTLISEDNCSGRYTFTISVTFQGSTTSLSKSFFINNPTDLKKGMITYFPLLRK